MKSKVTSNKESGCKEVEMQYKLRSKTKRTSNNDLPQKKATENIKHQQVSSRQGDSALKTEKNQATGRGRKSVCKRNKDGNENEKAGLGKPKSASIKIMRTRGNSFLSSSCVELSRDVLDSPDKGVPESSPGPAPSSLNLLQKPIDKEKEQHDCMKIKASFWVLNDDIIRAVQQKLRASENQTSIQQEQENVQPTRKSFPEPRASAFRPGSAGDAAATKNLGNHADFQRFDLCLDRVDAVMAYSPGSSYSGGQSGNSENNELVENDLQQMLIDAIIAPTTPEVSALDPEGMIVHSEMASEISFSPGHGQDLVFDVSEKIGPLYVSEVSEITQNEGVANEITTMTTVVPKVEMQVRSPVTQTTSPEMTSDDTVREMNAIVTESSDDHDSPVSTTILDTDTFSTCTVNKQDFPCDESMDDIVVNENDVYKLVSVPQNAPADQENSSDDDHDAMEMDFLEQTVHSDDEINISSRQLVCVSDASGSCHQICEKVKILEVPVKQPQETDFETGPHFSAHFDTNVVRNTETEKSVGGHNLSIASRSQDCDSVEKYECENINHLKAPLHIPAESPRKALKSSAERYSIINNVSEGSEKDDLNHDTTICVPEKKISYSINDLGDQDRGSKGASILKSVATCSKRIRKRRPKIKFTWKKMRKCQAIQPSLTRLMSAGSSDDDSWNFQRPITDQVLSGYAKISPDVENAASVLAMMKGNLFSSPINSAASYTFKSKTSDSDMLPEILSAARIRPREGAAARTRPRVGAYFCNVCGHASEELVLLKKHMIIHGSKHDVNKELLNVNENSCNVTDSESDCETNVTGGEAVDLSQPSQNLSMVLHKQNVPRLIINMRIEKISQTSLTSDGNTDRVKQTSLKVSRKVLAEALKEIVKDNFMSGSPQKMTNSASKSTNCRQVPVRTKSNENILENIASSEVEEDSGTILCEQPVLIESSDESSNEQDSRPTQARNEMEECIETSQGENDSHIESITVQEPSSEKDALEQNSNFHMAEDTINVIKTSQPSDLATDVNSHISESGKNEDISLVLNSSTCIICNHKFSSPANMRKHVRMKHNRYRPHKCPTCGKGFPYPSSLEEHTIIHSANPKRMQICDMCGKDFVRASGLRKHVKEHHENSRPYICHICEKGYIYLSALKEHLRSHSEDRTFKCSQCDSEFKHASNLLTHMKKAHRKNCSCPAGLCACLSKTPKAETTFDCKLCSRTFSGKRQLKIHMRIHGNKAHLICKLCNTEFPNKFLLTKHRLKHKETQSYDCVICSRSFLSSQSLKIHQNGHNGIKPYQCENCGKQYSTKSSLKVNYHFC